MDEAVLVLGLSTETPDGQAMMFAVTGCLWFISLDRLIYAVASPLAPSGSIQPRDYHENGKILPRTPTPEGTKRLSLSMGLAR